MVRVVSALAIFLLIWISGCREQDRAGQPPSETEEKPVSEGEKQFPYQTTVIPGTGSWDIDTNVFPTEPPLEDNTDFFWRQASETERDLEPKNGAAIAIVSEHTFDSLDVNDVKAAALSESRISGSDTNGVLRPGTVVAFRTSEGRFGKLQVVRYRPLHDLSFPEASILKEETRQFILSQPNIESYHLEVKWCLFD